MIYKVQAKFNYEKAKEFHQKLTDGAIEKQRPDGPEIIDSMNRATIDSSGLINWTELCYCNPPLQHERKTVYDYYFSNMKTEEIEDYKVFKGEFFMRRISKP